MKRKNTVRGIATGALTVGALFVAAPVASANVGCYQPEGNRVLRIVPEATSCKKGERRIAWSSTGAQGRRGAKGAKGAPGAAGAVGATGAKGETGAAGATGAKGDAGAAGAQGVQGAKGDKGDTGETGAQGVQGIQGNQGATGAQGEQGERGLQGVQGEVGAPGATGPQGETGAQGAQGETGAQGAPGATGAQGDVGPQGPQGPQGDEGPQGAEGPQGPQGPAGQDGQDGAQGPAGPAGGATFMTSNTEEPAVLTTLAGGLTGLVTVTPLNGTDTLKDVSGAASGAIDLTPMPTGAGTTGQLIGRAGTITSVRAYGSLTGAMSLIGTTVTTSASVWKSTGSGTFEPIPGAKVTMAPPLTGILAIGTTTSGTVTGLNIDVAAGDRLVVVLSAEATGLTLINTISMAATTSVTIS